MTEAQILGFAEFVGTIAFSVSGAVMAVKKRMDIFGILMMGLITAFGGGMTRDILLGQVPPKLFLDGYMLLWAVLAALAVFFIMDLAHREIFSWRLPNPDQLVNLFDAIGLGAFALLGTQAGITAGYGDNIIFCACLGTLTGAGGGMLRDICCNEIPGIFRKHIYAIAALAGSLFYYYARPLGTFWNTILTISIVFSIRLMATLCNMNLPKVYPPKET